MTGVENFEGLSQNLTENDVVEKLCGIKAEKAGSLSTVASNFKLCGQQSVKRLKDVANDVRYLDRREMSQSWRMSEREMLSVPEV